MFGMMRDEGHSAPVRPAGGAAGTPKRIGRKGLAPCDLAVTVPSHGRCDEGFPVTPAVTGPAWGRPRRAR
ncbi:hypothetical protein GCM10009530_35210 [Microbispora corallina]|uniref:Uncharacterized protein n=1 Tax=Microbispora corallina TaxID=83302 RepID=A0ABQ4FYN6_9ACTN|nr:hypothetical protein Mco01_29430 [Microbispora corallina]